MAIDKLLSELNKGEWSGATAYTVGDIISSGGSSYVCVANSTNNTPPNASYWALLASKGDTGSTGSIGTIYSSVSYQAIINAGFTVNQRGYVSGAALAGVYGHDRWKAGASGGNYSFTQLAQSTVITIAAAKSLIQVIEDKNVVGGTYTLSWTGTAQARYAINSATPAGSYAASPIAITGQTPGTVMSVEFNTGTLSNVQLNSGTVVLPFMPKSYDEELRACMRYAVKIMPAGAYGYVGYGWGTSTTTGQFMIPLGVIMRITPTVIYHGNFRLYAPSPQNVTSMSVNNSSSPSIPQLICTVAVGLTTDVLILQNNNDATAFLLFSSEL